MAGMADFARLPTRQKIMVFFLIGVGLGLAYYQLILKPLKADDEAVEAEQASKAHQSKQKDADIDDYKKLKEKMPQLQRIIDENTKALPSETESAAFFETINRKIVESGVQLQNHKTLAEVPVENFVKVPVTFEITGTFLQIKRFFASLAAKRVAPGAKPADGDQSSPERERIVSIENLSLGDPTVRSGTIVLTARFTAATFRKEETKEAAPTPPASRPAAPPPPAKPTPPANTPAGAKARTEGALDKSEKRTEDKAGAGRLKGGL